MRTSFAFPLLHLGVSNAVAVVADVAETSTTGNWWLIHWCKQSSRCCIWFHHQGRSHENLSGQVTLPQHIYSLVPRRFFAQHSSIVSIKIVSGFSTCNNNRTVTTRFGNLNERSSGWWGSSGRSGNELMMIANVILVPRPTCARVARALRPGPRPTST